MGELQEETKAKRDISAEWSQEIQKDNEKSNFVSKLLMILGVLSFLLSLGMTLFYSGTWYIYILLSLLVIGTSEVVSLLQKIVVSNKAGNRDIDSTMKT